MFYNIYYTYLNTQVVAQWGFVLSCHHYWCCIRITGHPESKSYVKIFANSFLSLLTLLSRVRDFAKPYLATFKQIYDATAMSLKLER